MPTSTSLTPAQIRAGRALVNWNQQQLADAAELSLSSVRDYENERRGGEIGGLSAIRRALENEGVRFLAGDARDGPGVRLNGRIPSVLRRPTKLNEHGALLIPIQWQGKNYELFVHRDTLEDLGEFAFDEEPSEQAYVGVFDRHRAAILSAAMFVIETGRVGRDQRVHIGAEDV